MNVAGAFQLHQMPQNSLTVRCHVLQQEKAGLLENFLVQQLQDCYIERQRLKSRIEETGLTAGEILANKLPDPGSVMSGDFGEILTLFFLKTELPEETKAIRKWRYKQDRLKAAPYSDVIILHRQNEQSASPNDFVICAEAKQKATRSAFDPITKAIEGFNEDRTGRLARTLVWLKEKAIDDATRPAVLYLDRFTRADPVPFKKRYKAVAVIDRALLDEEITRSIALPEQDEVFEVIVLGIDELYDMYNKVYARAPKEVTIE